MFDLGLNLVPEPENKCITVPVLLRKKLGFQFRFHNTDSDFLSNLESRAQIHRSFVFNEMTSVIIISFHTSTSFQKGLANPLTNISKILATQNYIVFCRDLRYSEEKYTTRCGIGQ